MSEIQFVTAGTSPGVKMAKWQRSAGINAKTGDVFVPAHIAGNEQELLLCASFDGEPCAILHKHLFVRSSWMKKEYPKTKEVCEKIESKITEAFKSDAATFASN